MPSFSDPDASPIDSSTARKRGVLARISGVLILLSTMLGASACHHLLSTNSSDALASPGQLVAVEGARRLHLYCMGSGAPTVLLEAGMSGWSSDWAAVQPALARDGRICAYDRAGYGWSDPMPEGAMRTPHADLEKLIKAADLAGPLVLVGHSMGGLLVADHARAHPHQVAGLVLVDAVNRTQDLADTPAVTSGAYAEQRRSLTRLTNLAVAVAPLGVLRIADQSANLVAARLPEPAKSSAVAQAWRTSSYRSLRDENAQFDAWLAHSRTLGALPPLAMAVLSSTEPRDFPPGMQTTELQSLWALRQQELALEGGVAAQPIARSGHYIHVDQPQAVIDAVRAVRSLVIAKLPPVGFGSDINVSR